MIYPSLSETFKTSTAKTSKETWNRGTDKKSSDATRYHLKGEKNKPIDSDTNPNSRILKHPNASKDILMHFFEYLAIICKGEGGKKTDSLKSNLFQLLRPSIVTAKIYKSVDSLYLL